VASSWGNSWGTSWATSWGGGVAPAAPTTTYQDPGFWTEEHRKIKEREEAPPVPPPVIALNKIPAIILPPKRVWSDADEIEELLELMEILDADRSLS
jgi:hypothetical protein